MATRPRTGAVRVALVTEVFADDADGSELAGVLAEAKAEGAEVAVLPELPLNWWAPCTRTPREEDAEDVGGPRQTAMVRAAAGAGLALVGGVIERDPETGIRYNTALLLSGAGARLASYRKVHLPEEEGYWETSHYEPGDAPPEVVAGLPLLAGLQVCSDVNRPEGFQLLAGQGAEVVFAPRATPPETYARWRLILQANAITSGAFVVSVNRPRPEGGTSIGGPSLAIDPFGRVLVETTDRVRVVELDPALVEEAAGEYPGYLGRFPALYAEGWRRLVR